MTKSPLKDHELGGPRTRPTQKNGTSGRITCDDDLCSSFRIENGINAWFPAIHNGYQAKWSAAMVAAGAKFRWNMARSVRPSTKELDRPDG